MPHPEIPWLDRAPTRRRYLAGISGGADSVALLHLLHERGFREVVVCHLHHGLRGADADEDARFVEKLARDLGYPCETGRADVTGRCADRGQSIETAAREARHEFFAACLARYGEAPILLAHHRDDQAETILWNLLRGSRGLTGMKERQVLEVNGTPLELLRPLLGTSREELRDYLTQRGLEWREDASNAEPFAVRNRLRNEALPLLKDIARRDISPTLTRAEEACREWTEIQAWAVAQAQVLDPQGRLHVTKLLSLPEALRAACVYDYLSRAQIPDLSREVIARCLEVLKEGASHATVLPGGRIFRRRQGRAFVEPD